MKAWPTLLLASAPWLPMAAGASGFVACDIEGTVLQASPGAEERTVEVEVSVLSAVRAKPWTHSAARLPCAAALSRWQGA